MMRAMDPVPQLLRTPDANNGETRWGGTGYARQSREWLQCVGQLSAAIAGDAEKARQLYRKVP